MAHPSALETSPFNVRKLPDPVAVIVSAPTLLAFVPAVLPDMPASSVTVSPVARVRAGMPADVRSASMTTLVTRQPSEGGFCEILFHKIAALDRPTQATRRCPIA